MKAQAGFLIGFVSGWAARSMVDSPRSIGAKAVGIVYGAQARLSRWVAVERERLSDLMAEVRAKYEPPDVASPSGSRAPNARKNGNGAARSTRTRER